MITLRDLERFSNASRMRFWKLIHWNVSFSVSTCLFWVTLSTKMVFKPIQPKHWLWDNIQYRHRLLRLRVFSGFAPIVEVMSTTLHLLLDLSISLLTKLNSSLDSRSSTNLRTVEGLPHVVSNFSFPFHKRAFPPVYWRKSIRYRRRAFSSAIWPREGHLLCFKSFEQCAKSVLNHKARTFDCRPIHQIFQAVPPTPTIQDYYGPPSARVAP